ncbi:hypothetical protein DPMN_017447 [Dreissena polymorpha]|uniref:Uncharacterized protein n=1 Tax=Dreissena polymorpha TaxID=45954 RepID=A0A9D4NEP9_DREPO|nr:hypothetical protein DPMN_017447 [Dreissena polymorpha]
MGAGDTQKDQTDLIAFHTEPKETTYNRKFQKEIEVCACSVKNTTRVNAKQ